MHRTDMRFRKRANRFASALEGKGIPGRATEPLRRLGAVVERGHVASTYHASDRLLDNRDARRRFADAPPALDDVQRRIIGQLDDDGYALTSFDELFGDPALWSSIEREAEQFVGSTEEMLTSGSAAAEGRKQFLVRKFAKNSDLDFSGPWAHAITSPRLLDLANSYLRLWSKLEYLDLWYSMPQAESDARAESQLWHRDFDDRHLLKAFLYLVDVDESTGPFEYVAGSHPGGRYEGAWRWKPGADTLRIADEELRANMAADAVKTFTGPKGTIVLCNTSGLHRGGFTTGRPRVLATVTYSSPASLAVLSRRNFTYSGRREGLHPTLAYALK